MMTALVLRRVGSVVIRSSRNFSTPIAQEVSVKKLTGEHDGLAVMTMNRPSARNAFSANFLSQFEDCIEYLSDQKDIRVMLLESAVPGTFCAGADLKERLTMNEQEVARFVDRLRNAANALEELPMPTIAVLDGHALGGGLEMALACDVRVASPAAKMGLVETKLAIIPGAGGTQRLPRIIGAVKAKELILTARLLTGEEAAKIGLVNKVSQVGQSAKEISLRLAEEMLPNGPVALKMAKLAINKGIQVSLSDGLAYERQYYSEIIKTKDRIEGLMAFGEKRKPNYRGE